MSFKHEGILGRQTVLELYGCETRFLDDTQFIEKTMLAAAEAAKATVVNQYFHQFSPYGVSGTIIITESHINIHTWPEYDFAAVDIFSCNDEMEVLEACAYLEKALGAKRRTLNSFDRGSMAMIQKLRESQTLNRHR